MTSNLETIEVSKVRGAAPAPQISAIPSSMACLEPSRFNVNKQKFLTDVIRRKYMVFNLSFYHDFSISFLVHLLDFNQAGSNDLSYF